MVSLLPPALESSLLLLVQPPARLAGRRPRSAQASPKPRGGDADLGNRVGAAGPEPARRLQLPLRSLGGGFGA